MSSSSKEELDELLSHLIYSNLQNFNKRWLLGTENPRNFPVKFCLSVEAFAHLLELINLREEHTA